MAISIDNNKPVYPAGQEPGTTQNKPTGTENGIKFPVNQEDLKKIIDDAIAKQAAGAMNKALGGLSPEDIGKMDLQTLMFAVMSERANMLDEQVRTMASEMQARNNEMKSANDMLAMARQVTANLKEGETADMPESMRIYFAQNGVETAGLSTDPTNSSATFSLTEVGKATGTVKTHETNLTKLNDAITKGDAAADSIKNMAYADNCAIKRDLPSDAINFAKAHGIPLPNGDGKSLKKDQISDFQSKVNNKISELKGQKTQETTKLNEAKDAQAAAQAEAKKLDDKANEGRVNVDDLNIQGGYKPSDVVISQTKEQWQANIENLKGHLESMNNQSQLDMIKFQSLMSKYTSQTEALSNTMKKLADNLAGIVGNLR